MRSRIVLDANILILLCVGEVNVRDVAKHRKLSQYTPRHFRLATEFVGSFERRATTSHCLSQASDALEKDPRHLEMLLYLTSTYVESHFAIELIRSAQTFLELGVADAGLIMASKRGVVLTSDGPLYAAITAIGRRAYHFWSLEEQVLSEQGTY